MAHRGRSPETESAGRFGLDGKRQRHALSRKSAEVDGRHFPRVRVRDFTLFQNLFFPARSRNRHAEADRRLHDLPTARSSHGLSGSVRSKRAVSDARVTIVSR